MQGVVADGLDIANVLENVTVKVVDPINLPVFDDVESSDRSAVFYCKTLKAKTNPENGNKEGVGDVPDVFDDAYVIRDIRRPWTRTNDDRIEVSE